MEIRCGKFTCEYCGKGIKIREQFVQEKDNEFTVSCPWCKKPIGKYTTYRNRLYIVNKDDSGL